MIPMALLFCFVWPAVQHAIEQFQFFLKTSGIIGVWCYTFSERILLPAGLHHFIYLPFIFGPAVCDGGIQAYWLQHLNDFATSAHSLKEMFPEGGFALHGMSKVFGLPGAALAMYFCAKPEKRKKVATLLIPATITAVLCGITEPLEFTFLFVAPLLYAVHAVLAATLSATLYFFGLSGNFGGGLIDCFVQNWIPLFKYHAGTYIMQIIVGLCFTAIYFFVFRYLILKNDYKTPGRTDDDEEDKLFSKAEYKAKKEMEKKGLANNPEALKAQVFLDNLGGPSNIKEVTNCATRLRVTVADPDKVASASKFTKAGAFGLVKNGHAIQVIVGLSVPNVRSYFDALLKGDLADVAVEAKAAADPSEPVKTDLSMKLKAFASGKLIDMTEVPDDVFSQKMMGDGVAIEPTTEMVVAPADGEVTKIMEGSYHAIGLRLTNGAEILIHIGLDTVKMGGKLVKITSPLAAMKHGISYLPEDRKRDGIIGDLSVRDNIILARQVLDGFFHPISKAKAEKYAEEYIRLLSIKTASTDTPIKSLSGGNQQKVILARWLLANPVYMILDEPTRGIDVGTKVEIQKLVLQLAAEGKSVTFISSEIDEMLRVCSRLIVMRDRQVVGELRGSDLNQSSIMKTIAGGEQA